MSELKIDLKILTPERTVLERDIYQATLPVTDGEVTILPNHRSYIASLKPGEIILKDKNGENEHSLVVSGGFIEFHQNHLVVLADAAERAEEIDIKEAEEAKSRAEELKSRKITDEDEYARVVSAIESQLARIKVAKKYQRKRR